MIYDRMNEIFIYIGIMLSIFIVSEKVMAENLKRDNILRIHVISPYKEIQWNNPRDNLLSIKEASEVDSRLYPWGHVLLEVKCTDEWGRQYHYTTDYGTDNGINGYIKTMIDEGQGFNTMAADLPPTKRIMTDLSVDYIPKNSSVIKRWNFLELAINPFSCGIIHDYVEDFISLNEDGTMKYNFTKSPLSEDGASCTSYAASMLLRSELIGAQNLDQWIRDISIPVSYFGDTVNKVSIEEIIWRSLTRRAYTVTDQQIMWSDSKKEDMKTLSIADPVLVFKWIEAEKEKLQDDQTESSSSEFKLIEGESHGIFYDAGNIYPTQLYYRDH